MTKDNKGFSGRVVGMVIGKVDSNGNLFTKEAMEEAIKNFTGCPLGYEFNPHIPSVGKVTMAEVVGNKVELEVEIDGSFNEVLAIVPSFSVKTMHIEDGVRVIDDADLIEFSLTSQPADEGITKQPL